MIIYLVYSIILLMVAILFKKISYKIERSILFVPTVIPKDIPYPLEEMRENLKQKVDPQIKLHEVDIPDQWTGGNINGIWFENPKTEYVFLYAHGNAGCIGTRLPFLNAFAPYGSVLMFDYKGFGKTPGAPSERVLYRDTRSAWTYLTKELGYDPQNIIVYGESLGCSAVSWLGHHLVKKDLPGPKALILQCGFSSLKNIAGDLFSSLITPVLSSNLNNMRHVRTISDKIPVMVAHSKKDELIDFYHSQLLLKANPNILFFELDGSHSGPENFTTDYLEAINETFLSY